MTTTASQAQDPAPVTAGSIALEVDNVSKSFGSINALEGASLKIASGRVTALVGDNGAGKSTLVKIMSGILTPTSGQLRVDGKPVELREARAAREQGIHTVFQDLGLVGSLSIVENMFLCTEMKHSFFGIRTPLLNRDAMRIAARKALDNLGVTTVKDIEAPVESLSGGQRQTVAIARAVRDHARVVILDEPTAALGVAQSAQVLKLMERLRASGTAVLVVSHNLREVFAVADTVIVLRLGRVAQVFETKDTTEEEVVGAIMGVQRKVRQ